MSDDRPARDLEAVRTAAGRFVHADTFLLGPLTALDAATAGAGIFLAVVAAVRVLDSVGDRVPAGVVAAAAVLLWANLVTAMWVVAARRWEREGVPREWFDVTVDGAGAAARWSAAAVTTLAALTAAFGA